MKAIAFLAAIAPLINLSKCDPPWLPGKTTRYWDCCKPFCAEPPQAPPPNHVHVCDIHNDNSTITNTFDHSALSACETGGDAYACTSQTPWRVTDTFAYGFTAFSKRLAPCCKCYRLRFTQAPLQGQEMVVQVTNVGADVDEAQFDLAIPGGGFGIYDACTNQWPGVGSDVWGAQYGGMYKDRCDELPGPLQAGCKFRFDWMKGVDNPAVEYQELDYCPKELMDVSGCDAPSSNGTQAQH